MNIEFHEEQKFRQWWIWAILIIVVCIPAYSYISQTYFNKQVGNQPVTTSDTFIGLSIGLAVFLLFWFMKLTTTINANGIHMRFFPFVNKRLKWSEIKAYQVVKYGFVGGWGIRLFTSYGTVYNISGDRGIAIELKNGKRFLIGTQKEGELRQVLDQLDIHNRP